MITYNHERYISQAISSILRQKTSFPFRLVIGEDHSTDSTKEICYGYAKNNENIILLNRSKNLGIVQNFIDTVNQCNAPFIAFCEGDDEWKSLDKSENGIQNLINHPKIGLIHTDADFRWANGKILANANKYTLNYCNHNILNKVDNLLFSGKYSIRTLTVIARTHIVKQALSHLELQNNPKLRMADTPLWISVARSSAIGYLNDSTSVYNVLDESASHSLSHKRRLQFFESMCEMAQHLKRKLNFEQSQVHQLVHTLLIQAFISSLKLGTYSDFQDYLQIAKLYGVTKLKFPYNNCQFVASVGFLKTADRFARICGIGLRIGREIKHLILSARSQLICTPDKFNIKSSYLLK